MKWRGREKSSNVEDLRGMKNLHTNAPMPVERLDRSKFAPVPKPRPKGRK